MFALLFVAVCAPVVQSRGSDIGAGIAIGTMAGLTTGVIAAQAGSSSRAERKARRAKEETERLRRERQEDKVRQIENKVTEKDLDRKDAQITQLMDRLRVLEQQKQEPVKHDMTTILFVVIGLLGAAVAGLGIAAFKKR